MKKSVVVLSLFLLMIIICGCETQMQNTDNIHCGIHNNFYEISDYTADCVVTTFTTGGENTYECIVDYRSSDMSYKVLSDDMTIYLDRDKTSITKDNNTIEVPVTDADMYIFVNTFFKSYYEAEDTTVSVANTKNPSLTLLECSCIRPTQFASKMKLWIDNDTISPVKMQIFNKKDELTSEIIFRSFTFG